MTKTPPTHDAQTPFGSNPHGSRAVLYTLGTIYALWLLALLVMALLQARH
jgi:hypothetical protein